MNIADLDAIRNQLSSGEPDSAENTNNTAEENPRKVSSNGAQHEVVSRIAYMIGVDKKHFENKNNPLKMEVYEELDRHKSAMIIRDLCIIRAAVFTKYTAIFHILLKENYRSIGGLVECIPLESIQRLSDNGVILPVNGRDIDSFIIAANAAIRDRINNCHEFIPDWIEWNYIFEFFAMPTGFTKEEIKEESKKYRDNINLYPYRKYIYWPVSEQGNILHDDRKFVTLLYEWHGEEFKNLNLVCGVGDYTKDSIYDFIEESRKTVFVVDCENSDPYALCAAISGLDPDKLVKIEKVILYDDIHAASAWEMLSYYIDIPVEYVMITRIMDNKSLADIKVTSRICREHYKNNVDSFVLVSSDSDFWGVIEDLEDARFIFMVQHEKFGYTFRNTLISKGIFYCFIDNFYAGDAMDIKRDAISREFARLLKGALDINLRDMLDNALYHTRISMSMEEKAKFIKKYIKPKLDLEIDDEYNVSLECRAGR